MKLVEFIPEYRILKNINMNEGEYMKGLIINDIPLKEIEDDRLEYAPFAKNVSQVIIKTTVDEGIVLGVFAPWGTGKTTFLNFIEFYLKNSELEEDIITLRFNPWWFTAEDDLLKQFLKELRISMGKTERLSKIANNISKFGDIISEIPEPTGISKILGKLLSKFKSREDTIWDIKKKISLELKKIKTKIVVFIDDIDRLPEKDIKSIFRVVKSVADFPQIIYILAFDKRVVCKALEDEQHIPAEEYLEKVIQIPFELPIPDRSSIRKVFFDILDLILKDTKHELFDETYFQNVYWDGIDYYLKTMRNVKRLTNTLKVTYLIVKNEVNPVDFLAIETIRIFEPEVYYLIRSNIEMFSGTYDTGTYSQATKEDLQGFHNRWLDRQSDDKKEILRNLLIRMFPKVNSAFENIGYSYSWESTWRKELKICSKDIFPLYFSFNIPQGEMTNTEMFATLSLTSDKNAFGNKLVQLSKIKKVDGSTLVDSFLERMQDYTENDIPTYNIKNILEAIFAVGDSLINAGEKNGGLIRFDNSTRMGRVMFQLLKRITDQGERFEILKEAMEEGLAISTIVGKITVLGQQHGKYGAEKDSIKQKLFSIEQVEQLESIAVEKIRQFAQNGKLVDTPELASVLYRWRDWEAKDAPRKWILESRVLTSDENMVKILNAFLRKIHIQTVGNNVIQVKYKLPINTLEEFINPRAVIARCESLAFNSPEWLIGEKKVALETFIKHYYNRKLDDMDYGED